jgi:two-component system capsular synthesis response regulator RcsB
VVLLGIKALLQELAGTLQVVGEAGSSRELLDLLSTCECDLLVTDYSMPDAEGAVDGMQWLDHLRRRHPELPVIVLTMIENPALMRGMLGIGIGGLVSKAAMGSELLLAIHAVMARRIYLGKRVREVLEAVAPDGPADGAVSTEGHEPLSRREAEVLRLYAAGISVTQIAERTHRSVKTISQQKNDAMRKLGLQTNRQLYEYAHSHGLLT